MTEHIAPAHARLAPSASPRWARCTGSVGALESLEAGTRDENTEYAQEGTRAHSLGYHCLTKDRSPMRYVDKVVHLPEVGAVEPDLGMAEAVTVYFDYVRATQVLLGPECETLLEHRVNPGHFFDRDDIWGTADAILATEFDTVYVIDYKHGEGVEVDPVENYQIMLYALGVLLEFPLAEWFVLVIVQPRCGKEAIREWRISANELRERAQDVFGKPLRELRSGRVEFRPGEAQCRWCGFRAQCVPLAEYVAKSVDSLFTDFDEDPLFDERVLLNRPARLTLPQLARCLDATPLFHIWNKAIWGRAIQEHRAGNKVPGYKLVRGKKNRVLREGRSTGQVVDALTDAYGVDPEHCFSEPELLSIAQLEALLTRKAKAEFRDNPDAFNALWHRPEGNLTVAPESDPRPAVDAGDVFGDIDEDDEEDIFA